MAQLLKVFISELIEKQNVHTHFLVRDKSMPQDKNGKSYLSLILADRSGTIEARAWESAADLSMRFQAGDVCMVKAFVQVYQGRKQLVVSDITKLDPSSVNMDDLLMRAARAPADMFQELLQIVKEVKDANLKLLIEKTITDTSTRDLLLACPAAKSIHHAYEGGLLEHILSITKIMKFLAQHYSFLNEDYLIFGAIFHDIGKIHELSFKDTYSYSDRGRLVGHMAIACEMIDQKAAQILGFSEEMKDLCKHIVLSHHGKLEYGSPKEPMLLEAVVVSMIDDLDSKLNTFERFMFLELTNQDVNSKAKWTRLNSLYDRYMYLPLYQETLKKKSEDKEDV